MSKKLHWFPFYYLDWLSDSDVAMMTYAEKGLFIDMLSRCFNEDGLPSDEQKLIRIFKCNAEDLAECVKLFYKKDEKLFNKKLDSIKKEQRKVSREKSKAGKKSAEVRKAKRLTNVTGVEQVLNSVTTEVQQNPTNTVQQSTVQQSTIKESKSKSFKKPTLSEVQAYCKEISATIDTNNFLDFYESKGWKVGSTPMKDWKACVRTWQRKESKASKGTFKETGENTVYKEFGLEKLDNISDEDLF